MTTDPRFSVEMRDYWREDFQRSAQTKDGYIAGLRACNYPPEVVNFATDAITDIDKGTGK